MAFIKTRSTPATIDRKEFYRNPENLPFYNLKEMLANRAARLLGGRGYRIEFSPKARKKYRAGFDRLNELLKHTRLQELMYEMEKRISAEGTTFLVLDMFKGMPTFSLCANGDGPHGVDRQTVTYNIAVIGRRLLVDIVRVPTIEYGTANTMTRIQLRDNATPIVPLATNNIIDLVKKDMYKYPDKGDHNMGFLPVWLVKNKPNWDTVSDPDDVAVAHLQVLLNKITEVHYKELDKNQTRVITSILSAELANAGLEGGGLKNILNDYIINLGNKGDLMGDPVTVIQGDPKLSEYMNNARQLINNYFVGSGYSAPLVDSDEGFSRSASQVFKETSIDVETTRNKMQQRLKLLYDMIEKMIKMDIKHGAGDIYPPMKEIIISIPENIAVTNEDILRRIQAEVPLGTMSVVKAISLINNISMELAEEEYKKIMKEKREQLELEIDVASKKFPENAGMTANAVGTKQTQDQIVKAGQQQLK